MLDEISVGLFALNTSLGQMLRINPKFKRLGLDIQKLKWLVFEVGDQKHLASLIKELLAIRTDVTQDRRSRRPLAFQVIAFLLQNAFKR